MNRSFSKRDNLCSQVSPHSQRDTHFPFPGYSVRFLGFHQASPASLAYPAPAYLGRQQQLGAMFASC